MSLPDPDPLFDDRKLTADSLPCRELRVGALAPTTTPGVLRIAAHPGSSDAVVDVDRDGRIVVAAQVGAGLAFAGSPALNWQQAMGMRVVRDTQGMVPDPHSVLAVRVVDAATVHQ